MHSHFVVVVARSKASTVALVQTDGHSQLPLLRDVEVNLLPESDPGGADDLLVVLVELHPDRADQPVQHDVVVPDLNQDHALAAHGHCAKQNGEQGRLVSGVACQTACSETHLCLAPWRPC